MLFISEIIISIILGIIEGITEFLPVSSTGHIILIKNICNYTHNSMQTFIVILQLGAILSVLITFRKLLYKISINTISHIFTTQNYINHGLCIQHIFIGSIPGIVIGLLFYDKIRLLFLEPIHIVYGLLLGSILLLISEWYFSISLSRSISNIDHITYFQAFFIGCFQCLAFFPGFSRFGSTIGGGLLIGLNRKVALEFSFLLAIPIILGSTILTLYRQKSDIDTISIIILFIGFVSAFISALVTMKFFLKVVQKISLFPFIVYRFLLAIIVYYYIHNDINFI